MVSYFTLDASNEVPNFQKEISFMMHGFGDNPNPNAAAVVLVETIVLQQMRLILQDANNYAVLKGSKNITNLEIIYLMRKNKLKLKRLHDYQQKFTQVCARASAVSKIVDPIIDGLLLEDDKTQITSKKNSHIDVIQDLDEFDEVKQIMFDVIDYLRKLRASKITETMSVEKYEAYHKARCRAFHCGRAGLRKNYVKFEQWINPTKEYKLKFSAVEVLSFLAYETVAEIVDCVFLLRQDAMRQKGDPFSKFAGGHFCNTSSLSNAVYIKSGYEGVPAITVPEIREVIRRNFTPMSSTNGLFYRNMSMDLPSRYIAM